jgi:hypothetical protein
VSALKKRRKYLCFGIFSYYEIIEIHQSFGNFPEVLEIFIKTFKIKKKKK